MYISEKQQNVGFSDFDSDHCFRNILDSKIWQIFKRNIQKCDADHINHWHSSKFSNWFQYTHAEKKKDTFCYRSAHRCPN